MIKTARKKKTFKLHWNDTPVLIAVTAVMAIIISTQNLSRTQILIIMTAFVVLYITAGICYSAIKKKLKKNKYLKSSLADLDKLSGEEFEIYIGFLLEERGYRVQFTPKSHDYGADLLIMKNRKKYVVQAKRYKGNTGISAVQQVIGAKDYYKADGAYVISTSWFTASAKKLAAKSKVNLVDRDSLINIRKIVNSRKEEN